MAQNGQNDHFGQNDLIPNRILVDQKWTKMVHFVHFGLKEVYFGPFRSVLWPRHLFSTPETKH